MQTKVVLLLLLISSACFSQNISQFTISGNQKTKTSFLKKIIQTQNNTILDSAAIEKDIQKIIRLPGIAYAYYKVETNPDNSYSVQYIVEENFSILPSVNFYTTNENEFAYRLGLYEFNALGRNIQLGGFFQRDIFNSYGIVFKAPYLFSPSLGVAISHQNLITLEPLYFSDGIADYKYQNISFEALLLYHPSVNHKFEIGANYFTEKYQYFSGFIDENVPQQLKIDKTLFKFLYQFSNVRSRYQYMQGLKSQFRFQFVDEVNTISPAFFIAVNDLFYYFQVGEKGTWASRFRIGFASNNDSPFAPFSLDNNINIRGVGNTIDRGTASIVLNTEYRYSFLDKKQVVLQSNVFIDTGTWREPGGGLNDFTKKENFKFYPGLGLRFIYKKIYNTILRIDYGHGISYKSTQGFVFGIGQYF
ncbi:MAG: POTRA domain-containing protein [Flavobacteriales bacterium]